MLTVIEPAAREVRSPKVGHTKIAMKSVCSILPLLSVMAFATNAYAQERPPGFEPMNVATDPNGVDLLSGKITFPVPALSVPAAPELSISRIQDMVYLINGSRLSLADTFQTNSDLRIGEATSERFECVEGDCLSKSPRPGGLVGDPSYDLFIYVQGQTGRTVRFDQKASKATTAGSAGVSGGSTSYTYWASQAVSPDGLILDFEYDLAVFSATTRNLRINKVKSNRGYQLRFTYGSDDPYNVYWTIPATAAIYREGEFVAPLASVSYPSGSATDMAGNTWQGNFQNALGVNGSVPFGGYRPPTNTSDQIVASSSVSDERGPLLSSLVKGGSQTWNYAYSHAPNNSGTNSPYVLGRTVTVTGPAGAYRKVWISEGRKSNARITKEVDGLNRTILYQHDSKGRVTRMDLPEGNATVLTYDAIGNITQVQNIPKAGSGQATITKAAGFPGAPTCTTDNLFDVGNALYCSRPLWVKDAMNNQTDYTWDATHGGMLTETGPAQPNGVRSQKRIEYVQRFAWYNNGSGTFVRSPSGIWLKSKERTCRTTATVGNACAGGAIDEVVTEYDYGPDSGPNYLLLRGVTVTAANSSNVIETLRTCYTYDPQGRKISETQPLGTGSVCP